ncbi:MAG: hypothetical protein WDM81_14195 [Rhizomicrobium sp.]
MAGFIVFASVVVFGTLRDAQAPVGAQMPIFFCILLLAAPLFWVVILGATFVRFRPISADPDGICNYFRGKPWKTISWHDVRRIEKRRVWDSQTSRYIFVYVFFGSACRIRFQEGLEGFNDLLTAVNGFASSCEIEIEFVDFGHDSMARARAGALTSDERHAIDNNGVRTRISSL